MMKGNGWTIVKSHIGGKCHKPKPSHTIPFKLYDDDHNLYFEGLMSKELRDSPHILDPMDANMEDYGVTSMKTLYPNGEFDWV